MKEEPETELDISTIEQELTLPAHGVEAEILAKKNQIQSNQRLRERERTEYMEMLGNLNLVLGVPQVFIEVLALFMYSNKERISRETSSFQIQNVIDRYESEIMLPMEVVSEMVNSMNFRDELKEEIFQKLQGQSPISFKNLIKLILQRIYDCSYADASFNDRKMFQHVENENLNRFFEKLYRVGYNQKKYIHVEGYQDVMERLLPMEYLFERTGRENPISEVIYEEIQINKIEKLVPGGRDKIIDALNLLAMEAIDRGDMEFLELIERYCAYNHIPLTEIDTYKVRQRSSTRKKVYACYAAFGTGVFLTFEALTGETASAMNFGVSITLALQFLMETKFPKWAMQIFVNSREKLKALKEDSLDEFRIQWLSIAALLAKNHQLLDGKRDIDLDTLATVMVIRDRIEMIVGEVKTADQQSEPAPPLLSPATSEIAEFITQNDLTSVPLKKTR